MSSTIISWGLTVSLIGVAVYVYRPDLLKGSTAQLPDAKAAIPESLKPSNKKAKPKKPTASKASAGEDTVATSNNSSDNQGNKKRKITSAPPDKSGPSATPQGQKQQPARSEDDGLSDKDFAKQLAMAQSGTKLQAPQKQSSQKDRRTAKLAPPSKSEPSGFSTEASSTTGRDADDDLTPGESPETQPVDAPISKAGDVSDMLEAPGAKPTTLRLTDVSNDSKPKKPASKSFEPVLSKKKRNEKQRKEEQRLLREESDRVHEAKKQEQLRKARMAAGTSNQTKANNFAVQANAWQGGATSAVKDAPATSAAPLLDTFEPGLATTSSTDGAVHVQPAPVSSASELKARAGEGSAAALTASAREGPSQAARQEFAGDLSEEDQIKILTEQQQEDAWESVTTKKSKRKGKQDNHLTSDSSSPPRAQPPPASAPVNAAKVNGAQKKVETVNRFTSFQDNVVDSGLQDAEWEA